MDLRLRQGAWMNWRMIFRSKKSLSKTGNALPMKKVSLLLAVFLLMMGASISAMNSFAAPMGQAAKDDMAERVRLSKDLHDIRHVRDRINDTIKSAADIVPEADRADFETYVQTHVDYDALEAKSIQYAAEVYTAPELRAMIAYFGSPDGQSAEAKGELFADKIGKDVTKEIDAAILAAKYDGVPEKSLPKVQGK